MKILITERQRKLILESIENDIQDNSEKENIGKRVMVYYNLHKHIPYLKKQYIFLKHLL